MWPDLRCHFNCRWRCALQTWQKLSMFLLLTPAHTHTHTHTLGDTGFPSANVCADVYETRIGLETADVPLEGVRCR